MDVDDALLKIEKEPNGNFLTTVLQTYKKKVGNYVNYVKQKLEDKVERLKIIAMITIEEHNKEVISKLVTDRITSINHFQWQQQLRFRRVESEDDEPQSKKIIVDQTNCSFPYGYEYQGNNGRLVVTPLTDRAYMTLTNALSMCRGGAP